MFCYSILLSIFTSCAVFWQTRLGESKYKQREKLLSDTTQQNVLRDLLSITPNFFFVTSIQYVTCMLRENLSNHSAGAQISHDIYTRFGRYLHSTKCSWIIRFIQHLGCLNNQLQLNYLYYPTLLRRVQIMCETSTNITRYLYSSHSPWPRELLKTLASQDFGDTKTLDNKSLIRHFSV